MQRKRLIYCIFTEAKGITVFLTIFGLFLIVQLSWILNLPNNPMSPPSFTIFFIFNTILFAFVFLLFPGAFNRKRQYARYFSHMGCITMRMAAFKGVRMGFLFGVIIVALVASIHYFSSIATNKTPFAYPISYAFLAFLLFLTSFMGIYFVWIGRILQLNRRYERNFLTEEEEESLLLQIRRWIKEKSAPTQDYDGIYGVELVSKDGGKPQFINNFLDKFDKPPASVVFYEIETPENTNPKGSFLDSCACIAGFEHKIFTVSLSSNVAVDFYADRLSRRISPDYELDCSYCCRPREIDHEPAPLSSMFQYRLLLERRSIYEFTASCELSYRQRKRNGHLLSDHDYQGEVTADKITGGYQQTRYFHEINAEIYLNPIFIFDAINNQSRVSREKVYAALICRFRKESEEKEQV